MNKRLMIIIIIFLTVVIGTSVYFLDSNGESKTKSTNSYIKSFSGKDCTGNSGNWSEKCSICSNITKNKCEEINGNFLECGHLCGQLNDNCVPTCVQKWISN